MEARLMMTVADDAYVVRSTQVLNIAAPGVLANDTEIGLLDYFDATSTLGAQLTWQPDGSFTYDPTDVAELQSLQSGETREDSFTYLAYGLREEPWTGTVRITVSGPEVTVGNRPPVAIFDQVSHASRDRLQVAAPGVLANDLELDNNDPLTVVDFDRESNFGAAIDVLADGSYTYTPTPQLSFDLLPGTTIADTFTYTIADQGGLQSTATVHVEYTEPLTVLGLFYGTNADTPLEVGVAGGLLTRRPDPNAVPVTLVSADATSMLGVPVDVRADGSFRYDTSGLDTFKALALGDVREDSFNYTLTNGPLTSTGVVTILVYGQRDGDEDFFTTTAEYATDFAAPGLLANDTAGPGLFVQAFDKVSEFGATITAQPDGSFRYDPSTSTLNSFLRPGDVRQDSFYYKHRDNLGNRKTILVTIDVTGFDHAVIAASDDYAIDNQSILRVAAPGLLANDFDIDDFGQNSPSSVKVFDGGYDRPGDADRDGIFDSSDLIQALSAGRYEKETPDTATWEQGDWNQDGKFTSADLLLALLIGDYENPNPPPLDLTNYDLNADGQVDEIDRMFANQDSTSQKGAKFDVQADGSFTYDPTSSAELMALEEGESTVDEFIYTLTDASGRTKSSFVRVSVRGQAKKPEANADAFAVNDGVTYGELFGLNVLENDKSFAADAVLSVVDFAATSRLGGQVEIDPNGSITYDSTASPQIMALHPGQSLVDDFSYTIEDAHGRRSSAMVTLTVDGAVEAPDDLFTSATDLLRTIAAPGVLANDTRAAHATLLVTGFDPQSALGATVAMQPDGSFQYDPRDVAAITSLADGQVLHDSFTYTTQPGGIGARHRVSIVLTPRQQNAPVLPAVRREPLAADPAGRQSVTLLAERPEYGSRYIEEFYAGLPEVFDPNAPAPTSRYEWEMIDFRGTPMLKLYLQPPIGGDDKLWRLHDNQLVEQIFVRTGKSTATLYTVEHPMPAADSYQSVWIVGFDRAPNRFVDLHGTKPVVFSGGNLNDYLEAKNFKVEKPLPGEDFFLRAEMGEGDDSVLASHLRDKIDLGPGNDEARAGSGDDLILAGAGKDTVDGGEGRNLANPGPAGEGDVITNASIDLPAPTLDVIQRKLKSEELGKTKSEETIWFDDAPPAGARFVTWRDHHYPTEVTSADGQVLSGGKAFKVNTALSRGFQFDDATQKLTVVAGDTLFANVYPDPAAPPSRIVVNFRVGTNWNYGAYWGPEPVLKAGQELKRGQSLWSADGALELVLQPGDGNLVLYNRAQGTTLWANDRMGGDRAVMQGDGNFVVYRNDGGVVWSSGTTGNQTTLELQQDGNLVIYGSDRSVKWSSNSTRDVLALRTVRLGDVPKAGEWTKLEIPAVAVGLKAGDEINGMLFKSIAGGSTWDKVGVSRTKPKDEATMSVKLAGDVLSILGSENYGFQIRGNWSISDNSGAETFTAAGAMTLVSKIGEIPFFAPPISIPTKTDGISGVGEVNQPSISFAGMDLKTTAIGALNDVFDKIGLNLTLSGMQFGVALGKTLSENLLKSVGAPLNDAIPYLYFSSFNAPQVSFGDVGIGLDNTAGMAVIFDPADPFMFVSGMDPRGDVLAVGVSKNGYIPFNPLRDLDERIGDDLFGNIYARGKVMIPVKAVDVGLDGELTIDTDLNDDGVNFFDQFDKDFFLQLLKGLPGQEADKFVAALKDLGVGINGKVTVALGKKGIGIELPVGTASAIIKGEGRAAFSGGSVNPWQGTFLERFNTTGSVAIDGYIDTDTFVITAKMETAKFAALQVAGSIKFTDRDISAELETRSPVPLFPTFKIKGNITFAGDFKLYAETRRGVDFGPFGAEMYMGLGLMKKDSLYQLEAAFGAGVRMNVLICKDLDLSFRASGLVGMGEIFEFNFRSEFRLYCDTPWYVPGPDIGPITLGFNIDNRGLTLPLPGPLPNLRVNF